MPVYAKEVLHGGPREFGLLMGASGVGAILGSLILATLGKVSSLGDWVAFAAAGFGGSLILLSKSHSFWLAGAAMLLIGFTMVTQLDASNTLVQRIVPDELRGRVMAIWVMMLSGLFRMALITGCRALVICCATHWAAFCNQQVTSSGLRDSAA